MELKYPQHNVSMPEAFVPNVSLTNHLQNLYWNLAEVKDNLQYTPETHAAYQHSLATINGKQQLIKELLDNFEN